MSKWAGRDSTVLLVGRSKNHQKPKPVFVSHAEDFNVSLPCLLNESLPFLPEQGRIFRFSRRTCNERIQDIGRRFGWPRASSHSFRAGFITDAFACGSSAAAIARHTRHKAEESLVVYDQPGAQDHASVCQCIQRSEL